MLDQLTQYFLDIGVAPLVGGFVIGLVAGFLARGQFRGKAAVALPAANPVPERPRPVRHSLEAGVANAFDALGVDAAERDVLAELARSDRALEAIKRLRELTGLGLKESKDLIDLLRADVSR